MFAGSVKYKGFKCFKNDWAGFDEFKPLTVIIGRNNSGKSHLLDMVELLTRPTGEKQPYSVLCKGVLDESFLMSVFRPNTSDGGLPGDHWKQNGRDLVGTPIKWTYKQAENKYSIIEDGHDLHKSNAINIERKKRVSSRLISVNSPLAKKKFRRILADRDIRPEKAEYDLELSFNGSGATNIIRRYIVSSTLSEDLIQVELLEALSEIFGSDGDFKKIEIRHHDEEEEHWEVYLGEPKKGLFPLSSSGSGLKTIILVLLNLFVIPEMEQKDRKDFVFAFEELENNLHPSLLRRLFKFITGYVKREECFVFLTTHSNVSLDFFSSLSESQIIHVSHNGESASAKTITAHFDQVSLLNELGAKPSDLLQANGIIWLEGPSDRIYINRFIELFSDGELHEGHDYQCAFYGGSILAKSTFSSPDESDKTFANLLRLNNNIAVVCDGDRTAGSGAGSKIKGRVQKVKAEVNGIENSYLWITEVKEIENYIPGEIWAQVYNQKSIPSPEKYDKFPTQKLSKDDYILKYLGRKSFDKCEFASSAAPLLTKAMLENRFELKDSMKELVAQIRKWNE